MNPYALEIICDEGRVAGMDLFPILLSSLLIFLLQPGFTLFEIGATQAKNAGHVAIRNVANFALACLGFYFLGYHLMFGGNSGGLSSVFDFPRVDFIGGEWLEDESLGDRLLHTLLAATCLAITAGALSERTRFSGYLLGALFVSIVIYPMSGRFIWGGGWLADRGMIDAAGSTVVFVTAGGVALGGTLVLGPRREMIARGWKNGPTPGHHFPLVTMGVFLLWLGWFGLHLSSLLPFMDVRFPLIGLNTIMAGCGGAIGALVIGRLFRKKPDPFLTLSGVLAGLVAGSGGIAIFRPTSILLIGGIAGGMLYGSRRVLARLRIDDPVGSVSLYGLSGVWGTLAVGLFAEGSYFLGQGDWVIDGLLFGGGAGLLGTQALGMTVVLLSSFSLSWVFFWFLKNTIGLRVSPEEESQGLDQAGHGMSAYPLWDEGQKKLDHVLREFKRAKELSLLHEISQSMHTLNLDEILELILKGVAQGIGFDRVRLYLLDEKKIHLVCRVAVGMEKEKIENLNLPYDPEDNIISRAIQEQRPFIVEDAREDPRVNRDLIRFLGVKSFAAVPLLSRSRVLGGIAADNLISQAEITENKLKSLMIFANQAALALENALMYEELKAFSAQLGDRVRRATEDLQLAQRQLIQSEKLAALGKIAAGIAHEIRNPLTSIKILIHSLSEEQATPAAREKDLAVIEGEIGRMNKIIKQFLDFARPRPPSLEPVEIEKILEETITLLRYEIETPGIQLVRHYTSGLPPVPMDSEQMKQVLLNLMLNSIQAMESGGVLTLCTSLQTALPGKTGESWIEAAVTDTGKGISAEIRERIFEPFFSTKEEGVGLGLPIAERIIEEHGGEIGVKSDPGKGTTFRIRLPLVKRVKPEAGGEERFRMTLSSSS